MPADTCAQTLTVEGLSFFNYFFRSWRIKIHLNERKFRGVIGMYRACRQLRKLSERTDVICLSERFRRCVWLAFFPWFVGWVGIVVSAVFGIPWIYHGIITVSNRLFTDPGKITARGELFNAEFVQM